MQWQDLLLTLGQIIFTISLLPSILSKNKPAFITSMLTTVLLIIFALIYISLSLYLASMAISLTAVAWAILAYQKYQIERKIKI